MATTLSILTYNVHCLPGEISRYDDARMADVLAYLVDAAEHRALDVIVLNESFHPTFNARFRAAFGGAWTVSGVLNDRQVAELHVSLVPPFVWGKAQVNGGVVVATRCPVVSSHAIEFTASCQFDSLAAKGVLHVELRKNGHTVHVFGTHMQALEIPLFCDRVRDAQFAEFRDMVARVVTAPGALVVYVGDFNEAVAPEAALGAVAVRCDTAGACATYGARQLDYILFGAGAGHARPDAAYATVVGDRPSLSTYSDHFPLLGVLTVANTPP